MNAHRWQNSGNVFSVNGGITTFFHERGRENGDGAITGSIYKNLADGYAVRCGGYRIEPDGLISRFAGLPRKYWKAAEETGNARYEETYSVSIRFQRV